MQTATVTHTIKVILLLFMLLAPGGWRDRASAPVAPTASVSTGSSPQLAVDARGMVRMVFGRGDTILSVTPTDHGITFSPPSVVGVVAGMHLGNTRGPVIASSTQRSLAAAIGKAGDIRAFQIDHATNRSTPLERSVNDRAGSAPEGLMTLAADGDRFAAAWLDNREQRRNQIYFTTIDPRAPRAMENVRVYAAPGGPVCECCRPTIAISKGTVAIMFRDAVGGHRDMYLATSRDAGRSFPDVRKLGTGTWLLDACPMDGGDMEISANGRVSSVGRRDGTIYQARPAAPESLVATEPRR